MRKTSVTRSYRRGQTLIIKHVTSIIIQSFCLGLSLNVRFWRRSWCHTCYESVLTSLQTARRRRSSNMSRYDKQRAHSHKSAHSWLKTHLNRYMDDRTAASLVELVGVPAALSEKTNWKGLEKMTLMPFQPFIWSETCCWQLFKLQKKCKRKIHEQEIWNRY